MTAADIDYIFAGDLLNQCISSTFGLRNMNIPFLGQYGACSTMAQTLALASIMVETGRCKQVHCRNLFSLLFGRAAVPLSAGIRRSSAPHRAVDGDRLRRRRRRQQRGQPLVSAVTIGRIMDLGIKDANNMGAAMALQP